MTYKLRKAPRQNKYWVITTSTGKHHSMMPLPKEEAEAQMKAMYANGGMHGGDMQGGARTTVAALTGVATNPGDTLKEFKGFFEDLAGIWNGGDVASGLRNNGKRAFATLIKYLPLAGAPGYAAATALEKLKIDSIINLLATLIDLITGRATLPQLFEALKEFIGNIFDLVKDFATNVLPALGNAVVSGLTSVGDTVAEAFDPRLKAYNEERRKDQALMGNERLYANTVVENVKRAAEQSFEAPKSADDAIKIIGAADTEGNLPNAGREALNKALGSAGPNPFTDVKGLSTDMQNQVARVNQAKMMMKVPYLIWLREHRPPEYESLPIPKYSKDEFYAKAAEPPATGQTQASTEFGKAMKLFTDTYYELFNSNMQNKLVSEGDSLAITGARGKLVKELSAEIGYDIGSFTRLDETNFPFTGPDLSYVNSAAYSKYPLKTGESIPTPGSSSDVRNPPPFPDYTVDSTLSPDSKASLKAAAVASHTKIETLFKTLVWNHAVETLQGGPNEYLPTTKRKTALLQKINSLNGGSAYLASHNYETTPVESATGSPTATASAPIVPKVDEQKVMKEREASSNAAQDAAIAKTLRERPEIQTELSNAEREVNAIQRFTGSTFIDYTPQHELGLIPYNPDNISWKKYPFTDIKPGVRNSTEPRRSQETNKLKYPATNATASGSGMSGGSMLIEHAVRHHPHKRMRENYDPRFFM
jgi:hypothetical protein